MSDGIFELEACAICGCRSGRELLRIHAPDRFERHVGVEAEGYVRRWMECGGCGVAVNVYSEGVVERLATLCAGYYEVDYQRGSIADKYVSVMSMPRAQSDNALRVERIHDFLRRWQEHEGTRERAVLDIGAGTGVFLSRFLEQATAGSQPWSGVAIEPDPVAAAHLRSLGRFTVMERVYARDCALADFDLCTLNKVLEHVVDPIALLRDVSAALRDSGGIVYVEVPDKATISYRPATDNILGALHRHLYDIRSLDAVLNGAGLQVLAIERLFEPSGKISLAAFATTPYTVAGHAQRRGQ